MLGIGPRPYAHFKAFQTAEPMAVPPFRFGAARLSRAGTVFNVSNLL
jgi:hypothetical protein